MLDAHCGTLTPAGTGNEEAMTPDHVSTLRISNLQRRQNHRFVRIPDDLASGSSGVASGWA
ncbi:hypothetical protein RHCRD62_90174 [Rhodococcus sp. RD6.2]|nr:hypothetical protein RHCRD62_90174 [Rhodococcus sp. RD6.2]